MKKFLILLVVFMVLLDKLAPISSAPADTKKKVTKGKGTTKKTKDVIKIEKTSRKPKTTKTTTQAPAKKALQYGLSGCVNNEDCLTNYCMITQFGGFCRCGFGSWSTTLNACTNLMVEGDSCYVDNNYSNNNDNNSNNNDNSNENNSGNSKGWNNGRKKRSGYNSDGSRHLCNTALGLNCQAGFCRCSYGTWNGQKCA
ncbi:unnamed protein product [Brachionus calyciflorus]|uniref:EGF-like domain-containing protein n=1 Tax=Brachionus calyciflorus TaxID=104777 RepID=A0A814GIA2_9BILA|nr:unnamed protein product [Brachionus calyciflorus]